MPHNYWQGSRVCCGIIWLLSPKKCRRLFLVKGKIQAVQFHVAGDKALEDDILSQQDTSIEE